MVDVNRGQVMITFENFSKVLQFRTSETMLLEELLGCGVIDFLARGGGSTKFLVNAIFAGLSRLEKKHKHTPPRIATWLDNAEDLNREETQWEILYAIARGKPGEEGEQMVRVLDDLRGDEDGAPIPEGQEGPFSVDGVSTSVEAVTSG